MKVEDKHEPTMHRTWPVLQCDGETHSAVGSGLEICLQVEYGSCRHASLWQPMAPALVILSDVAGVINERHITPLPLGLHWTPQPRNR